MLLYFPPAESRRLSWAVSGGLGIGFKAKVLARDQEDTEQDLIQWQGYEKYVMYLLT